MLMPAASKAPWICVRCQLLHARRRSRPSNFTKQPERHHIQTRALSRSFVVKEEGVNTTGAHSGHERGYKFRRFYPQGRIVGKPGRRQRETTAKLDISSLDRPSEVVLLRDVREEPNKRSPVSAGAHATKNSAPIKLDIEDQEEASEEEVHASIDQLRPHTKVVSRETLQRLTKNLVEGYAVPQLVRYIDNELRLTDDGAAPDRRGPVQEDGRLPKSSWRPGQTPLEKRHVLPTTFRKALMPSSKTKLARRITQLVWGLNIESEERETGEIELVLEPWKIGFLFDLDLHERAMYETLLSSNLLLQASSIRPYRPHNVVRITARRQIATDIANELETQLSQIQSLQMSLDVFAPLLGTRGWPERMEDVFTARELQNVGSHTLSVIERVDANTLAIRNKSADGLQMAQRMLLSYLDLPYLGSTAATYSRTASGKGMNMLPEPDISSLHVRYRLQDLVRRVAPIARKEETTDPGSSTQPSVDTQPRSKQTESALDDNVLATELASRLDAMQLSPSGQGSMKLSSPVNGRHNQFYPQWYSPMAQTIPWSVQPCRILHSSNTKVGSRGSDLEIKQKHSSTSARSAASTQARRLEPVQSEIPGIESLLAECCKDSPTLGSEIADGNAGVTFVAHLLPSPFADRGLDAMSRFPRMQLRFLFGPSQNDDASRPLHVTKMTAILEKQELRVPLPQRACDLRFYRSKQLSADFSSGGDNDDEIARFTQALSKSLGAGYQASIGDPTVKIKLPSWLAGQSETDTTQVEYLFDFIEKVEESEFFPLVLGEEGDGIHETGEEAPADECSEKGLARLTQVNAGTIGGRRTEISLYDHFPSLLLTNDGATKNYTNGSRPSHDSPAPHTRPSSQSSIKLVNFALGVTRRLTLIHAREWQRSEAATLPWREA